jgi:TatD DNase family protein
MTDALPPLVDTHAHLQDPLYDDDRDEVLERAETAGLRAIVCVGYDLSSSRRAVELAARHTAVYATVGIHPNYAAQAVEANWSELRDLAGQTKVVALGETGLDNYRQYTPPAVQERWFERHLELAHDVGLPVIVHNRQADERVQSMLSDWASGLDRDRPLGVMHCFSSGRAMLEACLSLGFTISLAGPVTFRNADLLRRVATQVPPDRLVVETDCPFLAPHPHRGERNEPAYLEYTARDLAEVRAEPFGTLAERTTRNAVILFGLSTAVEQEAKAP